MLSAADNCSATFVGLMLSADEHGMPANMSQLIAWSLHIKCLLLFTFKDALQVMECVQLDSLRRHML